MSRWLIALLLAALGIAAGIAYGWYIAPVQYVDTIPSSLRIDYRTDYVLMVAERFHSVHDLDAARQQLAALGGEDPLAACVDSLDFARASSYAAQDLDHIEELCRAVESLPSSTPSIGSVP